MVHLGGLEVVPVNILIITFAALDSLREAEFRVVIDFDLTLWRKFREELAIQNILT